MDQLSQHIVKKFGPWAEGSLTDVERQIPLMLAPWLPCAHLLEKAGSRQGRLSCRHSTAGLTSGPPVASLTKLVA